MVLAAVTRVTTSVGGGCGEGGGASRAQASGSSARRRPAEESFLRGGRTLRLRGRRESVLKIGELFKITSEEKDWAGNFNQRYMKLCGNLVGEMRRREPLHPRGACLGGAERVPEGMVVS
jgi:hypothetical protein